MRVYVPSELQEEYKQAESDAGLAEILSIWPKLTNWQKYQLATFASWRTSDSLGKRVIRFFKFTYYFLTNQGI